MIDVVKRYVCDACKKSICMGETEDALSWTTSTEIGDLCPSCSNAWENYKKSFVERMRIENKESIYESKH